MREYQKHDQQLEWAAEALAEIADAKASLSKAYDRARLSGSVIQAHSHSLIEHAIRTTDSALAACRAEWDNMSP
jgi:hypothetical protein